MLKIIVSKKYKLKLEPIPWSFKEVIIIGNLPLYVIIFQYKVFMNVCKQSVDVKKNNFANSFTATMQKRIYKIEYLMLIKYVLYASAVYNK